jgi:hypothetical protein
MVAPVVPLIRNKFPFGDQVPGMVECRIVKFHGHGFVFSRGHRSKHREHPARLDGRQPVRKTMSSPGSTRSGVARRRFPGATPA